MSRQTFVFRMEENLARRFRAFLARGEHGYATLDEFVEVAVFNQLNAEQSAGSEPALPKLTSGIPSLLVRPAREALRQGLCEAADVSTSALFVLTNRWSPIKVAVRALANLAIQESGWPVLREFHERAARAARDLGLRLRAEDKSAGRTGQSRRWIGYPVGEDEQAAINRFIFSFTILANGGRASGPLEVLGLARVMDGKAALTEDGWRLAEAESPLLDGSDGGTLSPSEIEILRPRIQRAPAELESVRELLRLVKRAAGRQQRLDELLAAHHSDWTAVLASAHRSAMIGRLGELRILQVSGRGSKAVIDLLQAADDFRQGEEGAGDDEDHAQAI